MFDLSFGEILLALIVAFVIFGPERFPVMLREAIGWIKKIKNMAFEAQRSLDDLGKSIEGEIKEATSFSSPNPISSQDQQATGSPIEPIKIDRDQLFYQKDGADWRSTLQIDISPDKYSKESLKELPWRGEI